MQARTTVNVLWGELVNRDLRATLCAAVSLPSRMGIDSEIHNAQVVLDCIIDFPG